jgi:hypothetical protein
VDVFGGILVALYVLIFGGSFLAFALVCAFAPIYLVWLGASEAFKFAQRHRPDQLRDLRRAYVAGEMTVEDFEERVEAALMVPAQPWRPRLSFAGVAAIDVCLALLVLLVAHAPLARIAGALLGVGALVAVPRRTIVYAFIAGVALLAAPLAGIAFGASAACRGLAERRA